MSCYIVARVTIHDRARYDRYAAAFLPVLRQYGGRLLASDEAPVTMEGQDGRKLVLLAFADRDAALAWANSPEYAEIAKDRIAGAVVEVVLAQGV
jgi:uncharacterized protein (DUF1330 family)